MKIRKDMIFAVLTTFCLSALMFAVIPIQSGLPYDPWADINDDGKINMVDIANVASQFMTSGNPTKNVVVLQNSTEGAYSFSLASNATSQNYTISTSGYSEISIYVTANTVFWAVTFEIFVGFKCNGVFVRKDIVAGQANWAVITPKYPWWHTNVIGQHNSFAERYDINFSEVVVAIWNNTTETPLYGTLYYYMNT